MNMKLLIICFFVSNSFLLVASHGLNSVLSISQGLQGATPLEQVVQGPAPSVSNAGTTLALANLSGLLRNIDFSYLEESFESVISEGCPIIIMGGLVGLMVGTFVWRFVAIPTDENP